MKKLTAVSSLIAILAVLPIRSFCVPAEPVVCKRASSVITIDGKLDDAAWKDCDVISFVVPVSHKKPKHYYLRQRISFGVIYREAMRDMVILAGIWHNDMVIAPRRRQLLGALSVLGSIFA